MEKLAAAPAPAETVTPPALNPLLALGDRQIPGLNMTLLQWADGCPNKDILNENLSPDLLNKVTDIVAAKANEAGWKDIPQELEPAFNESLARLGAESNLSFVPHEQASSVADHDRPKVQAEVTAQVDAKPIDPEVAGRVHTASNADIAKHPDVLRTVTPEPIQAVIAKIMQEQATTVPETREELVVNTSNAEIAHKEVEDVSAPRVQEHQLLIKPLEPTLAAAITEQATPRPQEQDTPALVAAYEADIPSVQEEAVPLMAVEYITSLDEALPETVVAPLDEQSPLYEVAEQPQEEKPTPVEILHAMLAFEAPDNLPLSDFPEQGDEETPHPLFSKQLEDFVTEQLPEAEQQSVLDKITDVKELVAATIEDELSQMDVALDSELAGLEIADMADMTLEQLAELPVSEELHAAVEEVLILLGIPEPTEQQIRQCVAKFRAEIIQARLEQEGTDEVTDILHERYHEPDSQDSTLRRSVMDYQKLLGALAVYMPHTGCRA